MIIEHVFVTTLDAKEALKQAHDFCRAAGFLIANESLQRIEAGAGSIEMARGKGIHLDPRRCRQSVHLEFDRGRVTVACSITPGRRGSFGVSVTNYGAEPKPISKLGRQYADLMIAFAHALELVLVQREPFGEAAAQWLVLEQQICENARKTQIRGRLIAVAIVAMFFVLIILIAINAPHKHIEPARATFFPPPQHIRLVPPPIPHHRGPAFARAQ